MYIVGSSPTTEKLRLMLRTQRANTTKVWWCGMFRRKPTLTSNTARSPAATSDGHRATSSNFKTTNGRTRRAEQVRQRARSTHTNHSTRQCTPAHRHTTYFNQLTSINHQTTKLPANLRTNEQQNDRTNEQVNKPHYNAATHRHQQQLYNKTPPPNQR